jgi:hypothetical protein
MRTFEYIAVTILGLAFAAWLAITVTTSIKAGFERATVQLEQASGK